MRASNGGGSEASRSRRTVVGPKSLPDGCGVSDVRRRNRGREGDIDTSPMGERGEDGGSSMDIIDASREMGGGRIARGGTRRRLGGSIDWVLAIPVGFPCDVLGLGESESRLCC